MRKILCAMCLSLIAGGAAQAELVGLSLPGAGTYASGTAFTTAASLNGATFDIQYTLNAFATLTTPSPFINSTGTQFGVGSANDPNVGNQQSLDGDDGEQLSITNLMITNFVPSAGVPTLGDLSISFATLTIADGTAAQDGVDFSFTGFGAATSNVTRPGVDLATPALVDLTALSNFSSTATSLFLAPDNTAASNRWSVSGIGVSVTAVSVPEPSSLCMLGLGSISLLAYRRKRRKRD